MVRADRGREAGGATYIAVDPNESAETRSRAHTVLKRILTFDFVCLLHFWRESLQLIDRVQKRWQDKKMNFYEAAKDIK